MVNYFEGTAGERGANESSMNEGPRISLPPMRDPYRRQTYDPEAEYMLPRVEVNKKPRFMPRDKTAQEILSEKQIGVGPRFNEMLRDQVYIDGGSGRKVPYYQSFDECAFGPEVSSNIRSKSWTVPTNIQKTIIPIIKLKRSDILATAPTGSGKTAAYLLPIIDELANLREETSQYRRQQLYKPYAIIVLPTKELVEQIYNDAKLLAEGTNVNVVRTYGDMPMGTSKSSVARGCDIFIATTGRLMHFVKDEFILLGNLRYFILDEADRLLVQQDGLDVIRYVTTAPSFNTDRRLFLFSATYSELAFHTANELLRPNYYIVQVGGANYAVNSVRQQFVLLQRYEKQAYLIGMLLRMAKIETRPDGSSYYATGRILIFVAHRREANRLSACLALQGFSVTNINGDRTLQQRHEAIVSFGRGYHHILVSTDIAARGLNIPDVSLVINYDLPDKDGMLDNYVHRIGRTGRLGNEGMAVSFFDPKCDASYANFYVQKLDEVGQPVPSFLNEITNGTAVGVRLQYSRDVPFAKFQAWLKHLSDGNNTDGGASTTVKHNIPHRRVRGDSGRDVGEYEF